MNTQALFERYNRKYWKGRLPHYTVVVTDKYPGGLCKKQHRTIYINPATAGGIPRTLLHEMAHAAVKGNEHGKTWLNEIKRLVRLGAPLKTELSLYAPKKVFDTAQILGDFHGAGFEAEEGGVIWQQVCHRLGYENGLVDIEGHPTNRTCARLLPKMRREWLRGRREKRRGKKAEAAFDAKMKTKQES